MFGESVKYLIIILLLVGCRDNPISMPDVASRPIESEWYQVSSYDTTWGFHDYGNFQRIDANGDRILLDLNSSGSIVRIWMTGDLPYFKIISDGKTVFEGNDLFDKSTSYLVGNRKISSGGNYCYLPIPFKSSIKVYAPEFVDGKKNNLNFYWQIDYIKCSEFPDYSAPEIQDSFNVDSIKIKLPFKLNDVTVQHDKKWVHSGGEYVINHIGRGKFVGIILKVKGDGIWEFAEGDERVYVDGKFRGSGTGLEDFFNAGWYFENGTFELLTHGCPRIKDIKAWDEDIEYTSNIEITCYRFFIYDAIQFKESFKLTFESYTDCEFESWIFLN